MAPAWARWLGARPHQSDCDEAAAYVEALGDASRHAGPGVGPCRLGLLGEDVAEGRLEDVDDNDAEALDVLRLDAVLDVPDRERLHLRGARRDQCTGERAE